VLGERTEVGVLVPDRYEDDVVRTTVLRSDRYETEIPVTGRATWTIRWWPIAASRQLFVDDARGLRGDDNGRQDGAQPKQGPHGA
jgi:hypothetical protein